MNRPIKFKVYRSSNEYPIQVLHFNLGEFFKINDFDDVVEATGLHDKNGKEIYEGDIVKCETDWNFSKSEFIGQVNYRKEICAFCIQGFILGNDRNYEISKCWGREIIGNIYENPELLKCKNLKQ